MKALSLALISLLFATACAKAPADSVTQADQQVAVQPKQTPFLFTLATCLPPAQSIYDDTKRLIFLASMDDEGKGDMDLMFESEPSTDNNNNLGFFVMKGGEVHVEESAWVVSGTYDSDSGRSSIHAKMPANQAGEQAVDITFEAGELTVVEAWTCRVH